MRFECDFTEGDHLDVVRVDDGQVSISCHEKVEDAAVFLTDDDARKLAKHILSLVGGEPARTAVY